MAPLTRAAPAAGLPWADMDSTDAPALVWFREDLRITDHAALDWAGARGPVIGVYVLEDVGDVGGPGDPDPRATARFGPRPLGGAAKWWLHHSLHAHADRLAGLGIELMVRAGDPRRILPDLAARTGARAVTWHRRHAPGTRALDEEVRAALAAADPAPAVADHPGHLLTEPGDVLTKQGRPFKVFTPFRRAAAEVLDDAHPTATSPAGTTTATGRGVGPDALRATHRAIDALELTPAHPDRPDPDWTAGLAGTWTPGEDGARRRLAEFLDRLAEGPTPGDRRLAGGEVGAVYADGRDVPAMDATSGLSPHLRSGEISPRQVRTAVLAAADAGTIDGGDADAFLNQLFWRDFAWHRRFHLPALETANTRPAFDHFPWAWEPADGHLAELAAWRAGRTGIPIVDAGMRELWATGSMHNRVRMIAGSFLTKNLGIHWRHGEEWFWDTLVDADEAANPFNWQWVAGSGDDASPYFRIFNPATQARKFDPVSAYVGRWVPEAGTTDYPDPIVDLRESRAAALDAYEFVKNAKAAR